MQPADDVGDDPQPPVGQQRQRTLEVGGGEVEVVDVADRLVGADDVEHHAVDAGVGQALGQRRGDDAGVGDHLHAEFVLDPGDVLEVAEQGHAARPRGTAGDQ